MAKMLKAIFTENGSPKAGLSNAVIYITDTSDDSLVIDGAAISEIGGGQYKYNFSTYNKLKDYFVVWDSVDLTGEERYAYSEISPAGEYDTEMGRITANVATETKQDIISGKIDALSFGVHKNVALDNFEFFMVSSTDHI